MMLAARGSHRLSIWRKVGTVDPGPLGSIRDSVDSVSVIPWDSFSIANQAGIIPHRADVPQSATCL
jgi:hypothetical protein